MVAELVDLSHTVEDGMVTYPGLPAPAVSQFLTHEASRLRYAPGTEFAVGRIDMVSNTGTYLDAPHHRFRDGADVSKLPLESLANLDGVVVRAPESGSREIVRAAFAGIDVRGRAVLLYTGWDRHWGSDRYFNGHPFLSADAAQLLVEAGAALVGIDSLNIDDTADGTRPMHTTLLAHGVLVVEHLCNLGALPRDGFRFFAVPPKMTGLGGFPVRAFAVVE